jgi:hypothetical protein
MFDVSGEKIAVIFNKEGGNKTFTDVLWQSETTFLTFGPEVMKIWSVTTQSGANALPSKSKNKVEEKKENTILSGGFCLTDSPREIYCGNAAGQLINYGPGFKSMM